MGEGREGLDAVSGAHLVWVLHGAIPGQEAAVEAGYEATAWMAPDGVVAALSQVAPGPVAAFAGIARPSGFLRLLRRAGYPVAAFRRFHDHQVITPGSLRELWEAAGAMPLVTTEKDLARLGSVEFPLWALRVEPVIHRGQDLLASVLSRWSEAQFGGGG